MSEEISVYEILATRLEANVGVDSETATDIVNYLDNLGVLDYDNLKEILLVENEDEDFDDGGWGPFDYEEDDE